ncbi:GTPase HflX [Peptoniphilus sp. KCTC 25270]|uniref:GTPase HflX n=1 Tax=Peptoniphilus sp. KCTC 25270 TaxID=2897414 RepID=UPI001E596336|nr:GTPase HflX [Peptoniphilus sp. KCTC 25270]MCD1147201.1 GTPase HflX [Peptoniphilus sp. KCTC 25270]
MKSTLEETQRIVIVGIWNREIRHGEESLLELESLAEVAGGEVVAHFVQNVAQYNPAILMGKGKLEELSQFIEREEIDLVIFDQELSGVQMRNLEEALDCPVLDRTGLILDIFALRAKSKEGKLQVLLGQLEYRKNHLIGAKNFSRLGGGIGTRGPGEQKLELDRRKINEDIFRVKEHLEKVKKQRDINRNQRMKQGYPVVSLVGYTNAGKSSLMNRMLREGTSQGKEVLVKDMPFASLDPDTRLVQYPKGEEIFLTDTVGFVSNLPTSLVKAFHATLEEVQQADVILHVLDGSREDVDLQYETTIEILKELEVMDRPMILFVNKQDKMKEGRLAMSTNGEIILYGSVTEDESLEDLYEAITKSIHKNKKKKTYQVPHHRQDIVGRLMNRYGNIEVNYLEEGVEFTFMPSEEDEQKLKEFERENYV